MRKLQCSRFARAMAVLMAAVTLTVSFASGLGIFVTAELGLYTQELDEARGDAVENVLYGYAYHIVDSYRGSYVLGEYSHSRAKAEMGSIIYHKNLAFEVLRGGGKLYSSYDGVIPEHEAVYELGVAGYTEGEYSVRFYLLKNKEYYDELYFREHWIGKLYEMRYALIFICVTSVILSFLFWLFALWAAGKRITDDGYAVGVRTMFDRVPLDLLLFLLLIAALVETLIYDYNQDIGDVFVAVLFGAYVFADSMIVTLMSMTVKVRILTDTLLTNNVITRLLKLLYKIAGHLWRSVKSAARFLVKAVRCVPMFWRTLLATAAMTVVNFIIVCIAAGGGDAAIFLFVIFWLAVSLWSCFSAWNMTRLRRGAKRIAEGDLSYRIDTKYLLFDFKRHAEDLNSIKTGMATAVEERMRGEMFKTELITNVSHDIKTPLTSIINYVDLLKKCDIENEEAKEYIGVLERQSARLKKLTEDLVTASKASSGVMKAELSPCDLGIFIGQTVGEYKEKLKAAGLTLVVSVPESPVTVEADGKLLWRIFDNLMNNALKYSLPGSRVYLTLKENGREATATVTNVSREPITRDGGELTERFVRGDDSRHTEGSGLGLSIAKSFAELQGGTLDVTADADLFRVTVSFPCLQHGKA